jgi:hypothetical protein
VVKKELKRLKILVHEAYMAAQARGDRTEDILTNLGEKFNRSPETIKKWVADISRQRRDFETQLEELKDQVKIVASGEFYLDETGEVKRSMPRSCLYGNKLLV